jgi:hypothetical protein
MDEKACMSCVSGREMMLIVSYYPLGPWLNDPAVVIKSQSCRGEGKECAYMCVTGLETCVKTSGSHSASFGVN